MQAGQSFRQKDLNGYGIRHKLFPVSQFRGYLYILSKWNKLPGDSPLSRILSSSQYDYNRLIHTPVDLTTQSLGFSVSYFPLLQNDIHITVKDLYHASTLQLTLSLLTDYSVSPTNGNYIRQLSPTVLNCFPWSYASPPQPATTVCFRLGLGYTRCRISILSSEQTKSFFCNHLVSFLKTWKIAMLLFMEAITCCLFETPFVLNGRNHFQLLNSLSRINELIYKPRNSSSVTYFEPYNSWKQK